MSFALIGVQDSMLENPENPLSCSNLCIKCSVSWWGLRLAGLIPSTVFRLTTTMFVFIKPTRPSCAGCVRRCVSATLENSAWGGNISRPRISWRPSGKAATQSRELSCSAWTNRRSWCTLSALKRKVESNWRNAFMLISLTLGCTYHSQLSMKVSSLSNGSFWLTQLSDSNLPFSSSHIYM